jgi:hypothetical protein
MSYLLQDGMEIYEAVVEIIGVIKITCKKKNKRKIIIYTAQLKIYERHCPIPDIRV